MNLVEVLKGHRAMWSDGGGLFAVKDGRSRMFKWYGFDGRGYYLSGTTLTAQKATKIALCPKCTENAYRCKCA